MERGDDIPAAYTPEQVSLLTGVSRNQLRRWEATGFYAPEFTRSGLYSFMDLVALGTLHELRNERGIRLQVLRKFGPWLRAEAQVDNPWASLRFYTDGREVVVKSPDGAQQWVSGSPVGQLTGPVDLPFAEVVRRIRIAARGLRKRSPEQVGHIERSRGVMGSQPRIAGTRIPTRAIWDFKQAGYSVAQILREYPSLSAEDVEAAIEEEEAHRSGPRAGAGTS